ncbi:cylicin-1-like [Dendronephthya gigantea]|uniref:cylicin-1-like n=1 Tax=Dendronephthya gigantea TaxID=151771 RepID=UPI001069F816|nr:cylicin-1-like [Dendronephthya gigantea]
MTCHARVSFTSALKPGLNETFKMVGCKTLQRLACVLMLYSCFLQSVCEDNQPTDNENAQEIKISGTNEPLSVTKEENDEVIKPGLGLRKEEDGKTSAQLDSSNVSIHEKIVEIEQQDLGKTKEMKGDEKENGKKDDSEKEDNGKEDGKKDDGEKKDNGKEDGKKDDGEEEGGKKDEGEKEAGKEGEKGEDNKEEDGTEEQMKEKEEEKENVEEKGMDLKDLKDNDFEHLTQASTGATTGDWLVLFTKKDNCDKCVEAENEMKIVYERVKHKLNVAKVTDGRSTKMTFKRFGIEETPVIYLFHHGKQFSYVNNVSVDEIIKFLEGGYQLASWSPVRDPYTSLEYYVDETFEELKHMFRYKKNVSIVIFITGFICGISIISLCGSLLFHLLENFKDDNEAYLLEESPSRDMAGSKNKAD